MSGVKLTPAWALKAAQAVQDAVIAECEAERFLYMLPTGYGKETMDRHIALALSQAYERGQESMRERAADARYILVPEDPTAEMCSDAVRFALSVNICSEYTWPQYMHDLYKVMTAAAIRSLPIEQEGGE